MKNVIKIPLSPYPGWQTNAEIAGCLSSKLRRHVSISRETLVISRKRSYKRTSASKDSTIPRVQKIQQFLIQATHPISRKTLVISRKRSYKRTSASKDSAIPKVQKIQQFLTQATHPISRKTLVISRKRSYKRTSASKASVIPKIHEILLQTTPQSLVKLS